MKEGGGDGVYESQYRQELRGGGGSVTRLEPILENEDAQAVHLRHF